jgi:ATP-dependent DNA helicase PIF1
MNLNNNWKDNEIKILLFEIKNKKSIDDISVIINKTNDSINNKLLDISYTLIDIYGIDINIVSSIVNLNINTIKNYIKKINKLSNSINLVDSSISLNLVDSSIQSTKISLVDSDKSDINENKINDNTKNEIMLSQEQSICFEEFKSNKNIFLTGPAGAGKTVTINKCIDYCKENNIKFGITSSTGSSALLIGGKTLHSYLGIGLAKKSAKDLYIHNRYKLSHTVKKIRELNVLIIDEISIIDLELFEKVSEYLALINGNRKPFGGLQVLLCGDFCQLEPVNGEYCFISKTWSDLNLTTIFLTKMIRQNEDKKFQKILKNLRYGICDDKILNILKERIVDSSNNESNIKPTILYSKNIDVDKINNLEYNKLLLENKKVQKYDIKLPPIKKNHEKILNWINSSDMPLFVELCVDAQVMVTANINQDNGIVNGTRGFITELYPEKVIIKTLNDFITINYHKCTYSEDNNMYFNYMPIKLAYAISIHKSQGITLDSVEIDIGKDIFAAGQAYTAISRARNLKSIVIKSITNKSFICKSEVLNFYSKIDPNLKLN